MNKVLVPVLLGVILFTPGPAAPAESVDPQISAAVRKIHAALPYLRFTPTDLLNPPRWEIQHAIPEVEKLLEDPAGSALRTAEWNASLQKDHSPRALAAFLWKLLGKGSPPSRFAGLPESRHPELEKLPSDIREPVRRLLSTVHEVAPLLARSCEALTPAERREILQHYDMMTGGLETASFKMPKDRKKVFAALRKFDQDAMLSAAGRVMESVQQELPRLISYASNADSKKPTESLPLRFKTVAGEVLIFGTGEDTIHLEDLESAAIYVKLGGKSVYEGTARDHQPGRIRLGIDMSRETVIRTTGPAAGSAVFGIDLLFLSNGGGSKTIETGSYSQGFGLCGVGGLFVNGSGLYRAARYSQGVGIFGAGFFVNNEGDGARYESQLYGQGVGFTRGVGAFIHRGDGAELLAGLVDPDPRETLGATSLSQGVGCGPRAYAGGGLGLCLLKGDALRVESSYFAQGAGYWHAAGSFALEGSSCTVKARRYDQGSGVHSAFGMFSIQGDGNRVVNWGVGPAFGWDGSVGWSLILGNKNRIHTEWSAASASLGASRSFSVISGEGNKIDLPGMGSGQFIRDLSDLAVSVIDGPGNRIKSSQIKTSRSLTGVMFTSPWGLISVGSATLVNDIGLEKESWHRLPSEALSGPAPVNLEEMISVGDLLGAKERVERFVQVAAAFSVDKNQPRRARAKLIGLKPADAALLLDGVDFADVDGFIQTRVAAALWGDPVMSQVGEAVRRESDPQRRAMLLSLLSVSKAGTAAPALLRALTDTDWRVQSTAIRVLGVLLARNPANISGRVYGVESLERWLASGGKPRAKEDFLREFLAQPYAEAISIISAAGNWGDFERATLFGAAPEDVTSSMNADQAEKVLAMLEPIRDEALKNVRNELLDARKMRDLASQSLATMLYRIKPRGKEIKIDPAIEALTYDLLTALGKMGMAESVAKIEPYLDDPSAKIREGAAVALARIGGPARKALLQRASSWDSEQKMNAMAAVTESADRSLVRILESGLADDNQEVRQAAMSAIERLQRPLEADKTRLKEKLRRPLEKGGDILEAQRAFLFGEP